MRPVLPPVRALACARCTLLAGLLASCMGSVAGSDEPGGGGGGAGTGGSAGRTTGGPGTPGATGGAGGASTPVGTLPEERLNFATATRRLTRTELRQTLLDLVGADFGGELAKLPEDYGEAGDVFAFDNKYSLQQPSAALVEAVKNLAEVVAGRVTGDAATRARVLSCTPTGPADATCLRTFVTTFGRRALRRALTTEEVTAYVTKFQPLAVESNDFNKAVSLTVRSMLQDMEFLYRIEIGQPVANTPGLLRLGGYEVASRLSYFLWGTMPDEALLVAAETGEKLQTAAAIRTAALRMFGDPRARPGIGKFHAMWLGYERQPPPAPFTKAMLDETAALLERVVLKDKLSWLELFRSKETYIDGTLATQYGLTKPAAGSAWVPYGTAPRQGVLSHGSFLGVERKHQDTSPTMRGQFIRIRLMCQHVPDPPPDVDTDSAPKVGNCKSDRYNMWQVAGCKTCHQLMDPIGHGLENFDQAGKYRTIAPDDRGKTGCEISGAGELVSASADKPGPLAFKGVGGLADRLIESGVLEACLTTQLAHYYLGRELKDDEKKLFERVSARFREGGRRFDQMLLDFVTLPGFGFRVAE